MKNKTIRDAIRIAGLKYWEVAEALGVADTTFTKWLRHELPKDKQQQIMSAIEKLKKAR